MQMLAIVAGAFVGCLVFVGFWWLVDLVHDAIADAADREGGEAVFVEHAQGLPNESGIRPCGSFIAPQRAAGDCETK